MTDHCFHGLSRQVARSEFPPSLENELDFLPRNARDMRYIKAAILRGQGMKWRAIAEEVGLSQGRCQNLTQELWWGDLIAWVGRRAWGGEVVGAAVSRIIRCLRQLPPESPQGLEYTRLSLLGNSLLGRPSESESRDRLNADQDCSLSRLRDLPDTELVRLLEQSPTR